MYLPTARTPFSPPVEAPLEPQNAEPEPVHPLLPPEPAVLAAAAAITPETSSPSIPVRQAPLVPASICVVGHSNPPESTTCRLCGAPVPPQATQMVPRPVLARLRSPDGTSVDLDRPVLVGRAPMVSAARGEAPHLLTVPSPGQDISRTHLDVTPDGWQILLTDLHSTTGPRSCVRARGWTGWCCVLGSRWR